MMALDLDYAATFDENILNPSVFNRSVGDIFEAAE